MKKVMFVGETRVGKSSLIRALSGEEYTSHRAMAVEYVGRFVNTPGEFLENSWFYNALITTSADCDMLVFVQDATRGSSLFPPLFAPIFNRRVVGVVSKVDAPEADAPVRPHFQPQGGGRGLQGGRTGGRGGSGRAVSQ